ncbi:hypothetical protein DV737_g3768, partial [Chaetothyriales sp. CBS 132003]
MNHDGLLNAFYADNALCAGPTSRWLARIVSQITFRHPGINILEVGAGTGATTNAILYELGSSYNSYTFTDISSSFFLPAEERFGTRGNRIIYKTFDMEKEPKTQGYVEGSYGVVTAVNVLHVSADVSASLSNVRRLLKPGGFLVVAELTSTDLLFAAFDLEYTKEIPHGIREKTAKDLAETLLRQHVLGVLDTSSESLLWTAEPEVFMENVMNGAMILDDELFANMKLEQFTRVTKPKVLGTELLDELFHDVALDFFIAASSIASVIGWRGQSNYSAANEYMTSLINKRRNRGFHGAAINIPAVLGLGYAAHADNFDMDNFESLGHININEEDLRQLVAEAILSGRPNLRSDTSAQVCMGVNYAPADLNFNEVHSRDVRFGHFVSRDDTGVDIKTTASKVRVKAQLEWAKSRQEYFGIIHDGFVHHLRRMLRIPEEESIETSMDLVEVGIDSLVAVDIRAWFLKEIEVDVPTLKILGGSSITDLVQTAVEKLPPPFATEEATSAAKGASSNISGIDEHASNRSRGHAKALSESRSSTSLSSRSPVFTPAPADSSYAQSYAQTPLNVESLDKQDALISGKLDFKLPPAI